MMKPRKGAFVLSNAVKSIVLTLLPIPINLAFWIFVSLNPENLGYMLGGIIFLPVIHIIMCAIGLTLGIFALVEKKRKMLATVSVALAALEILVGAWFLIGL